ncbi:MAG: SLC13 family permease [Candidatus Palauibacterales bacterium]|nr:SLC13 family permease [Candidatus Palauibacterales bacterium]
MPGGEALLTLAVLALLLTALVMELYSVDMLMMGGLTLMVLLGVVELERALQGFANPTLAALGSLYVVAAGLRESGALDAAAGHLLGQERSLRSALARLVPSVTVSSAFLNNTPIVAMAIPAVRVWSREHGLSASKLLMPLSYAAILGGICTLIGTSTNLVIHGLLQSHGMQGLGFFELAWVGVPCALAGWGYLVFVAPALLPDREEVRAAEERERGATVELEVEAASPLAGRTVEEASLETLPGLGLVALQRGGRRYGPVDPDETLTEGDVLVYEEVPGAGDRPPPVRIGEHPVEGLRRVPGVERERGLAETEPERERHEVVIRDGSPLVGAPLEQLEFPDRFNAVVTGVRRGGRHVEKPLGEIRLRPGDVLMLETAAHFRRAFEDRPEFFVASESGEEERIAPERAEAGPGPLAALAILGGVVVLAATGVTHIAVAGVMGAFAMVAVGFLTPGQAREAVDWSVLVVVGAALGLGQAMEASGAAAWLGAGMIDVFAGYGEIGIVGGLLLTTAVLTEVITNNGAAALVFPIALSLAAAQGLDPRPLAIAVTIGASVSMLTPIGYQTNLMVYGPGNYRFFDFTRVGAALWALVLGVALVVIPIFWPL